MRLDFYVRHYEDEQRQEQDPKYVVERTPPARRLLSSARTVGGCTAHYAMIIIRPHDSDWRTIADATGDGTGRRAKWTILCPRRTLAAPIGYLGTATMAGCQRVSPA
jgi:choline dehydrogenase-like flavoprotein